MRQLGPLEPRFFVTSAPGESLSDFAHHRGKARGTPQGWRREKALDSSSQFSVASCSYEHRPATLLHLTAAIAPHGTSQHPLLKPLGPGPRRQFTRCRSKEDTFGDSHTGSFTVQSGRDTCFFPPQSLSQSKSWGLSQEAAGTRGEQRESLGNARVSDTLGSLSTARFPTLSERQEHLILVFVVLILVFDMELLKPL